MDALDVVKILGPSVLAFLAGRWQKAWEIGASDLKERLDELCKLIDKIGDDSSGYWERARVPDDDRLERRLKAELQRLELLRLHCAEEAPAFSDRDQVVTVFDNFFDAVSGGTFESATRAADVGRAVRVRDIASRLNVALRDARRAERRMAFMPKRFRR